MGDREDINRATETFTPATMPRYPWDTAAPENAAELRPPDDIYITLDRWPKLAFETHYHDAFNWLVPVRPGQMVVRVQDREVLVSSNSWICIFPNEPHAVVSVSDNIEVLSLFLSHADMFAACQKRGVAVSSAQKYILGTKGSIAQGLALQWAELRYPSQEDRELLDLFRPLLCHWMWGFYGNEASCEESLESRLKLKMDVLGTKIGNYLQGHLEENPFDWDDLSTGLGFSKRTLQRKIQNELGMTPSDLLTRFRIQAGKELLADPSQDIALISLKCGFSSQSHFSTIFKAHTGSSPRQFRAELAPWVHSR